jgi:hypothetical protein
MGDPFYLLAYSGQTAAGMCRRSGSLSDASLNVYGLRSI